MKRMYAMRSRVVVFWCGVAMSLGAGLAVGEVAQDFSGGGYPGGAEGGWSSGWVSKVIRAKVTEVKVEETQPLVPGVKNYLKIKAVSVPDGSGEGAGGAVVRGYGAGEGGVNPAAPVKYVFTFRVDELGRDGRYVIYETNRPQANSGGNATWQISATGGYWRVMNGAGNGGQQVDVNTNIPVVEGKSYSFVVKADPVKRTWSVEISDGNEKKTFDGLNFRTTDTQLGGNIHFGFSDSKPDDVSSFQYSIGNIEISSGQ